MLSVNMFRRTRGVMFEELLRAHNFTKFQYMFPHFRNAESLLAWSVLYGPLATDEFCRNRYMEMQRT